MANTYSFEAYRSAEQTKLDSKDAESDASALLERLAWSSVVSREQNDELLRDVREFCAEVTLNIKWYEQKRREAQRTWYGLFALILLLTCGGGVLMTRYPQLGDSNLPVTFMLGLAIPAIQAFASAIDYKGRLGAFWLASAELKELLFSIEDAWRGKDLNQAQDFITDSGTPVSKTFKQVLEEGRIQARRICREERKTFFSTYKTPSELLAQLSTTAVDMRSRNTDFLKTQKELGSVANLKTAAEGLTKFIVSMNDPTTKKETIAASVTVLQGTIDALKKNAP